MAPIPTYIFRILCINYLLEILEEGYIYCYNHLNKIGKSYKSIAYESIMDRRASTIVPCGPRGNLLDYVAFYFAPRSPVLYTISKGNVEDPDRKCRRQAEFLVYNNFTLELIDGIAVLTVQMKNYVESLLNKFKS